MQYFGEPTGLEEKYYPIVSIMNFVNISEQKESSQHARRTISLYICTRYLDVAMRYLDVTKDSEIINILLDI